ncbi:MAG: hypothetical protein GX166_14260 [Clostridiaceae bacterium]|nr:hypothetical protein [Clostridiaceae bacterium]
MICKFCGFEDTGKYCSNCGKLLSEEVAPITKKNTIKLGFGKSSSANYSYALNLIQQQPTYTTEENGSIHTAVFTEDNIEQFFNIFDYIKNWKSSFVEINGQRVPMSKINVGLSCFRERQKAYNPQRYCYGEDIGNNSIYRMNPLGCRLCGIDNSYWRGGWYTIGSLSKSGIFTVDKNQIQHIVKNKIEEIGFCPALNIDEILMRISKLPDTINPKTNKNFEYLTIWENGKSIATGIRMKEKTSGFVAEDSDTYDININLSEIAATRQAKKRKGCGCSTVIAVLSIILILIIICIRF